MHACGTAAPRPRHVASLRQRASARICPRAHAHAHTCTHMHTRTCTFTHAHACIHMHTQTHDAHTHAHVHTHAHTHAHTHMFLNTSALALCWSSHPPISPALWISRDACRVCKHMCAQHMCAHTLRHHVRIHAQSTLTHACMHVFVYMHARIYRCMDTLVYIHTCMCVCVSVCVSACLSPRVCVGIIHCLGVWIHTFL